MTVANKYLTCQFVFQFAPKKNKDVSIFVGKKMLKFFYCYSSVGDNYVPDFLLLWIDD